MHHLSSGVSLPQNQEKGNADKWKHRYGQRAGFIWIFVGMTLSCKNTAPNNNGCYQQTFFHHSFMAQWCKLGWMWRSRDKPRAQLISEVAAPLWAASPGVAWIGNEEFGKHQLFCSAELGGVCKLGNLD